MLGVAPLGASSGDGKFFPVDHDEYVQIPAESLVARDGRYEVRVTEELSEVTYLDHVKLIAVDHPAASEIYTNDKWKSPPFPEFRLFGVTQRIYPVERERRQGPRLAPMRCSGATACTPTASAATTRVSPRRTRSSSISAAPASRPYWC